MAKQLNVNLAFTADTSQAKAQIQDLQNSLNKISTFSSSSDFMGRTTNEIKAASSAALELQAHLKNAINQDTGRLDFSKFSQSLKKSGVTLDSYMNTIRKLGPEGEQAFLKMTRAISTSEIPMRRSNQLMQEMWTTMKNTARWQISSSALHAFMGTMSSAYGYAQDLNESLNNIRIVTGYSTDQMAKFAKEANKSAKALSTTTTEYTNASLIYYQQGLNDQQVKERTDITVKMANVSRESAQTVSDQMTAVWNNFYDGSKSLEYYADVMTALGAATASSTAEISAGLEKFAAIAETVGLSYEYSTAALATITATTRQNADVVGNALKTLFARIQGLSLGETLEDGVDLNKYSKALDAVGVKVLESNGQMREMDDILNDLAAKWDTIGKAEQTALAQTVAGVRQYTQLVALMDNWDFMKENLQTAYSSTGALEEQANIYADSWEAASDRVRAAAENIYDSLINDEFFITLLNGFEGILTIVGNLIDSFGGMGGAISAIGVIFTKVFSTQMQQGLENMAYSLKMSTEIGRNEIRQERLQSFEESRFDTEYGRDENIANIYSNEATYQRLFLERESQLSERGLTRAQLGMDVIQQADDYAIETILKANRDQSAAIDAQIRLSGILMNNYDSTINDAYVATNGIIDIMENYANIESMVSRYRSNRDDNEATDFLQNLLSSPRYNNLGIFDGSEEQLRLLLGQAHAITEDGLDFYRTGATDREELQAVNNFAQASLTAARSQRTMKNAVFNASQVVNEQITVLNNAENASASLSATIINSAEGLGKITVGLNAFTNVWDTLSNPDISGWDKFLNIFTSLTIAIPAIVSGVTQLKNAVSALTSANALSTWMNIGAQILQGTNVQGPTQTGTPLTNRQIIEQNRSQFIQDALDDIIDQGLSEALANNPFPENRPIRTENYSARRVRQGEGYRYERSEGGVGPWREYDRRQGERDFDNAREQFRNRIRQNIEDSLTDEQRQEAYRRGIQNFNRQSFTSLITAFQSSSLAQTILTFGKFAGAIGIVALGLTAASQVWHAHEKAVESASIALEKANENYQNTQNSLQSFQDSFDNFNNAKENISTLTRGTEEYTEAIEKANDEAKKLIETYGLYGQFSYDSEGLIKFNNGVLENIENQKEQAVLSAENLKYFAEYDLSEANLQRQKVNLSRKMNLTNQETGYSANIEDVVDALQEWRESKTEDSFVDYLISTGNQLAQFGNEITPNLSALESLADSVISAADAADYFTKSILQNKIEEQYGDQIDAIADSNEEADLITSAIAENIMAQNENILKDYGSNTGNATLDAWNDGLTKATRFNADMGILNDEDLARQYAMKILGKTEAELANMIYKGGIGKGSFTDLGGKTIIAEISDAEMREQLARQEYLDKNISTENTAEAIKMLDSMKQRMNSSKYGAWNTMLSSMASGEKSMDFALDDYRNITESEYELLKGITNGEEFLDKLGLTKEDLQNTPWENDIESFMNEFWDAYYKGGTGEEEWQKEKFRESSDSFGNQQAELYDLNLEEFKAYRDLLYSIDDELAAQPELLNAVAIAQKRYEKGIKSLNNIQKEHNSILSKANKEIKTNGKMSDKSASEISVFSSELKEAIGDLLDLSDEQLGFLEPDFAVENWDLIQKALKGSREAYLELQKAAANDTLEDVFNKLKLEGVDTTELEGQFSSLTETLQTLADKDPIEIQGKLNDSMFLDACTRLVNQAGMTAAQAQAYFDDLGYDAEVEVVDGPPTVQNYDSLVPYISYAGAEPIVMYKLAHGRTVSTNQYLRIKSINKKSTDGPSAPTGGGGGGGGGSKPPEKPKEHEKERYYTLTNQLEDIQREYDEISKAAERAFGKDKLDLIDQQIAKTEEQIKKQKELVAAVEANVMPDQQAMIDSYNKLFGGAGPQFQFDERGIISNFDEIQDYIWDQYQITEAEDNKDLKEDLDAWMKLFEETRDKVQDERAKLKDLERQQLDLALQKIEYEIELRVELTEDSLDFLDYQLSKIEDDAFKAGEAIANMGEQMNSLYEQAAANEKGIHDILANRGVSEEDIAKFIAGDSSVIEGIEFTEMEIEQLRNYRDGLLENAEAMEELRKSIEEQLMEVFDAWIEKLDQGIERVEFFGSVLESYGNIIDIVGKKTLGITDDFMNNLGEAVVKNAIDNMEALKAEEKAINETLQVAQNELEKARATGDERLIKYWEDQVANLTAEAQEAHEAFLSSWEEALDQAAAVFEAAVEAAVEQFNEAIYSLGGLEGLAADFEKQQELADMYLEDYRKIYELSKLNRDINKSIDDTDNLAAKRKLRDLQEEINALEEAGVEMSEYDLEYLQAKYELRLAEIALEEAQNAKDTVRLQKDNEGNYSYVYTANTDAVDEAQQKYEDALYEMQDLSSNYVDEMSSQIIDATQQMMEELSAIRTADYASEQERDEAYARTEAYWLERIGRMKDELNKSIGNNKKLYDEDWTNYHNATGYKISDTDKFVTNFADSMYGALMGVDSTADLMDIIANATSKLIEDLITANNTFTQNQEEIFNAAETSIADFANDAAGSIEKIGEASKQTTEDVKNMSEEMKTDMNDIIGTIAQFQEEVFPVMDEFISKWETAVAVVNELITAVADLGDLTDDNVNVSNSSGNNNTSTSGNSNTSSSQTNSSSSSSQQSNTNNNSNKINNSGYTGDWSDNTAYANYIQEQIQLNQDLLEASIQYQDMDKIMDTVLNLIDLNARQASMAFGTLTPSGLYDEVRTTLQQEVSITAEFPNVQDHNEIAEALNNLINSASQYANRKL